MKRPKEKAIPNLKALRSLDDAPMTAKELAGLRPMREVFPDLSEWSRKRKRARKGEAHKTPVSIRLSPEVIAFYKGKGSGWQTRIDETLRAIVAATK
jgi:uncharacterized protein (DUF4415 family)